jgi:hypothetical protein
VLLLLLLLLLLFLLLPAMYVCGHDQVSTSAC